MELSQIIVKILDTLRFKALFGGLGTTYDVHLGLIGNRVSDFLLVLIELFSLCVTAQVLRAKIDKKNRRFRTNYFHTLTATYSRVYIDLLTIDSARVSVIVPCDILIFY